MTKAVPAELARMLDEDAGKPHSAAGPVMMSLARILVRHEKMVRERIAAELRSLIYHCPEHDVPGSAWLDPGCPGCQRHTALVGVSQLVDGRESPSVDAVRERRLIGAGRDLRIEAASDDD